MECGRWNEEDWEILLYTLKQGNCILMLGPDASAEMIDGEWRPLTAQLSEEFFNALEPELRQNLDKTNLAQAAQFYYIKKKRSALHAKVHIFYETKRQIENEIYTNLAALPFHLILTSTPDTLFYEALKNSQKTPELDRYNFRGENQTMVHDGTVEAPLVFHLYGILDEPESLVLTEIDLIDFLAAVIAKNPPLPNNILSQVRNPNKSLLFLGFGFKHWYLRILLHVLQGRNKESSSFALEQCVPQNMQEFQQTILFFSKSRYNIQICEKELSGFTQELRKRYEKGSPAQSSQMLLQSSPTVFLCYVNEDQEKAENLSQQLETAGFKLWQDLDKLRTRLEKDLLETTSGSPEEQRIRGQIDEIDGKRRMYELGEQQLPFLLQKKLVEFLTSIPNMSDSNAIRAFLYNAGLDTQLQNQFNVALPPAQFFQLLVPALSAYG